MSPLSTYMTPPVTAEERGESKKAATFPTSVALSSFWMGAFAWEYLAKQGKFSGLREGGQGVTNSNHTIINVSLMHLNGWIEKDLPAFDPEAAKFSCILLQRK